VFVLLTLAVVATEVGPVPDAGPLPLTEPAEIAAAMARGLLAGDVDALAKLTPSGFSFEGRQTWNAADIKAEWLHALEQRPLAGVQLYGVDVMTYEEMVKRHGKPPARLSQLSLPGTKVAIINLGGRAIVLVFKKKSDGWTPIAISD
jgi:hypothetical protein